MVLEPEGRPPVAALWRPEVPCAAGLDPLYIEISDSGGLDLEVWCLDVGCWQDRKRLEEVTEVTAFGERGLEEISTRSSFRSSAGWHAPCTLSVHQCDANGMLIMGGD